MIKGYKHISRLLAAALITANLIAASTEKSFAAGEENASGQVATVQNLTSSDAETDKNVDENSSEAAQAVSGEQKEKLPDGMKKIAENDALEMYFDEKTTYVAVVDKASGMIWSSNPLNIEEDKIAKSDSLNQLKSQFVLEVLNYKNTTYTYNNYAMSISVGQYEYQLIDNGIKIIYSLGEIGESVKDTPQKVKAGRFQSIILNKLSEEDQERIKKYYTLSDDGTVWTRKKSVSSSEGLTKAEIREILELLEKAGYDKDDLESDNLDNRITSVETDKIYFVIPIVYRLEGENLVVTVPREEIVYSDLYPINKLQVLPFFGAAFGDREEGYAFIPDGSGALMNIEMGDKTLMQYNRPVYGDDEVDDINERVMIAEQVLMPVYGMKRGDHAFFAIIEDSDALADILASKGGKTNSYTNVFGQYIIVDTDYARIGSGISASKFVLYQEKPYQGEIKIRYAFLNDEDANYSGMAKYYRNYLVDKYNLEKIEAKEDIPFFVETVGTVPKTKSFLGISYRGLEKITSYTENIEILKALQDAGISNIKLKLSGWFNEGMDHTMPTRLKLERVLGGKNGFKKLISYAETTGVELYPDVAVMSVAQKGNGFSKWRDAAKTMDDRVAMQYLFAIATYTVDEWKGSNSRYVLAISRLPYVIDKFIDKLDNYYTGGISLRDIATNLNSDYDEDKTVERQAAKRIVEEQLIKVAQKIDKIMVETGNVYAAVYADSIIKLTDDNSWFRTTDERVPFYQMVFHGYKEYAGNPINLAPDKRVAILRAIEVGASPNFEWIYEESSIMKDTDFNHLYSCNYEDWLDDAIEYYKMASEALKDVQDQIMVGHEKLSDGVYKTVYENGQSVIVNYNEYDVEVDGVKIGALDFTVVKGGK